jgi:hypothetical protein
MCSSCSRRGEHSDWCPRLGLDYDPNPAMTDDEVRALGYSHRDDRGYWQKPNRPAPNGLERHRAIGARRCLSCATDPNERDHLDWCPDATPSVGEALRDSRDCKRPSLGNRNAT